MRHTRTTTTHQLLAAQRSRKQLDSLATLQGKNVSGTKFSKVSRIIPLSSMTVCFVLLLACSSSTLEQSPSFDLKIEQVTSGTKHHFFGYIGQCQTIPWNATGQYILGLEIDSINRMPKPEEAATIILIDTYDNNKIIRVDKTNAWNPQQGTMFYWNPLAAETQFFFNDRDVETGEVFTVIYDIKKRTRVHEFRFHDTPIGNGGVAADGSAWLGLNYGRLARLRLVTGYPEALDWSKDEVAPENDGIFIVDIRTGKKRLLVSYHQLEEKLLELKPDMKHSGLFINHTLWNRGADRVYFFVRSGWGDKPGDKNNVPCSINTDGTGLTLHETHIGGHPEWAEGNLLIGSEKGNDQNKDKQVFYNVDTRKIVGQLGDSKMFPKPEGDISLSPDGNWFVNGYKESTKNYYAVYRRSDSAFNRSEGIDKGSYSGDIRIDPAPRWNRTNDAILVPGIAENKTRQMFMIRVITSGESPKEIGMKSAINRDIIVTALGKTYLPPSDRIAISVNQYCDGDGGPSSRNTDAEHLVWKEEGYFKRNRDLGQVFLPEHDFHLDALVLRLGPSDNAVKAGAPGAELFLQFFEVNGEPRINDNGTPQGTDSKHGFSRNHRCDDFIDGVTYRSIRIARGGIFPALPPTTDKEGRSTGDKTATLQYLRFDLKRKDELVFEGGKRYAFMVGLIEPGPERAFALANCNAAKYNAPVSNMDKYDNYHDGWALRREGDGTIPPVMTGKPKPPDDATLFDKMVIESLFNPSADRFNLSPTSEGYPDVDTYRDLEFYLEVHLNKKEN